VRVSGVSLRYSDGPAEHVGRKISKGDERREVFRAASAPLVHGRDEALKPLSRQAQQHAGMGSSSTMMREVADVDVFRGRQPRATSMAVGKMKTRRSPCPLEHGRRRRVTDEAEPVVIERNSQREVSPSARVLETDLAPSIDESSRLRSPPSGPPYCRGCPHPPAERPRKMSRCFSPQCRLPCR